MFANLFYKIDRFLANREIENLKKLKIRALERNDIRTIEKIDYLIKMYELLPYKEVKSTLGKEV